jgi:hypothetical protein
MTSGAAKQQQEVLGNAEGVQRKNTESKPEHKEDVD